MDKKRILSYNRAKMYFNRKREAIMYLIFLAIWIILNGQVTGEILAFGLAVCALLYLFVCKFTNYSVKKDLQLIRRFPEILYYVFVLIK